MTEEDKFEDLHGYDTDKICSYPSYEYSDKDVEGGASYGLDAEGREKEVWEKLYNVQDPEMPISIVDLGLIYELQIDEEEVKIEMTVTYSGCPGKELIKSSVKESVNRIDWVKSTNIILTYSPPWSMDMISERGEEKLKDFGISIKQ